MRVEIYHECAKIARCGSRGRSAAPDVRGIVAHGRALLGRAVRAAWQARLLSRDPDGLFAGVLGAETSTSCSPALDAPPRGEPARAGARAARRRRGCRSCSSRSAAAPVPSDIVAAGARRRARRHRAHRSRPTCAAAPAARRSRSARWRSRSARRRTAELLLALGAGAPLRRHRMVEVSDKARAGGGRRRCAWRRACCAGSSIPTRRRRRGGRLRVAASARGRAGAAAGGARHRRGGGRRGARVPRQQRGARGRTDLVAARAARLGAREIVREACRRLGVPLLVAPVGALIGQPSPADAAGALLREALLARRAGAARRRRVAHRRRRGERARCAWRSAASSRPLVITSSGVDSRGWRPGAQLVTREVRIAPTHQREEVWRELLPDVAAGEMASLYRVGVGAILRCAERRRAARARARPYRRRPRTPTSPARCAPSSRPISAPSPRKVDVSQTWEDLVVPDETGRTIAELVDQLRHRSTVLGRWGFQRKLGKGLGTTALFSGEPGTGKSMVAGLIAARARPRALSDRSVARAVEVDRRDREEPGQGLRRRRDRPRGAALRRGRRALRQAHHRRQERRTIATPTSRPITSCSGSKRFTASRS